MLTKDQVINAGVKYILLESCGGEHTTTYSLVLTQNETFDYVCDNPDHPQVILTLNGWQIDEKDDARYDVIYDYIMKQRTEQIATDPDFWDTVESVATELCIDCEWATEEEEELSEVDRQFMEELSAVPKPATEYEELRAAIRTVWKWVEKPNYELNTLEFVQQRLCANWIEHEATHRVMVMNLSGKALEGWLALLASADQNDHAERFITLIKAAQEILALQQDGKELKAEADAYRAKIGLDKPNPQA